MNERNFISITADSVAGSVEEIREIAEGLWKVPNPQKNSEPCRGRIYRKEGTE